MSASPLSSKSTPGSTGFRSPGTSGYRSAGSVDSEATLSAPSTRTQSRTSSSVASVKSSPKELIRTQSRTPSLDLSFFYSPLKQTQPFYKSDDMLYSKGSPNDSVFPHRFSPEPLLTPPPALHMLTQTSAGGKASRTHSHESSGKSSSADTLSPRILTQSQSPSPLVQPTSPTQTLTKSPAKDTSRTASNDDETKSIPPRQLKFSAEFSPSPTPAEKKNENLSYILMIMQRKSCRI